MTPNSLAGLARRPWYESPWRIAGSALASTMALLLLGVVAVLFVVPTVLGGAALTVLTGSMEPTFAPGDIVVVRGIDPADVCADVTVGQIVTFFPEPERPDLITHRVIGKTIGTFDDGTDCRLVTQGDANSEVDPPVSPAQVRGVFVYGVPRLGWVRQWAQQNTQALVVGIAVVTVTYGLWSWLRPPKRSVRVLEAPGGPAPRGALGTEGPWHGHPG